MDQIIVKNNILQIPSLLVEVIMDCQEEKHEAASLETTQLKSQKLQHAIQTFQEIEQ